MSLAGVEQIEAGLLSAQQFERTVGLTFRAMHH